MKKAVSLCIVMVFCVITITAYANNNISEKDMIKFFQENNILLGDSEGIRLDDNITNAEAAALALREAWGGDVNFRNIFYIQECDQTEHWSIPYLNIGQQRGMFLCDSMIRNPNKICEGLCYQDAKRVIFNMIIWDSGAVKSEFDFEQFWQKYSFNDVDILTRHQFLEILYDALFIPFRHYQELSGTWSDEECFYENYNIDASYTK